MEGEQGVLPQHLAALATANRNRQASAKVRAEVAAGELSAGAALYDERAGCLSVLRLLESQHRWGRQRALKVLRGGLMAIPEEKLVRDLTARQRAELLNRLSPS